jgi:hypothetical protein
MRSPGWGGARFHMLLTPLRLFQFKLNYRFSFGICEKPGVWALCELDVQRHHYFYNL